MCGLAASVVGCISPGDTVRGQNPAGPQAAAVQQAGLFTSDAGGQWEGSHERRGFVKRMLHHNREGWYPTHRHTYDYQPPQGLVYPPAQQPAAVIQYPYYTLKGPDCFFLKD